MAQSDRINTNEKILNNTDHLHNHHNTGHNKDFSLSESIVYISDRNITAYNNRNLTIVCYANLTDRIHSDKNQSLSFTTNARMVLTFLSKPRNKKPLHQMQSFLHCDDPNRTRCRSEFNLDVSCIEDQMDRRFLLQHRQYRIEAACQVDDIEICSSRWIRSNRYDCYDIGDLRVIKGPRLGEKCLFLAENITLECGINQECSERYGICLCRTTYIATNKRCIQLEQTDLELTEEGSLIGIGYHLEI
ncbi:hypothetical protein QR98_0041780 [Sarcoptes scabiei]|uniref:Uncharacterized protein n=1 Tax=Sarcoptes scabiei TaxID=52283 RepID=A0A132A4D0_SARSC|nr:hypothetical protein QR98_0041780 [Sarcoptes scabiei]